MSKITWYIDQNAPAIVTLTARAECDPERYPGVVNFDAEIYFPGLAKVAIPSVLIWKHSDDLTQAFYDDIQGYLSTEHSWVVDRLKRIGFKFKREWLTPEILDTAILKPGDAYYSDSITYDQEPEINPDR